MKDLYDVLGLKSDASSQAIKKAYRALALDAHPDKGGDAERMGLLNEAYQTLSDADRKRHFDADWQAFQEADVEHITKAEFDGYLHAGSTIPYSHVFKVQHQALAMQYQTAPLKRHPVREYFQSFESGVYHIDSRGKSSSLYHDIFTFIRVKTALDVRTTALIPTESFTPVIAIKLFMDFLSGDYYGENLITLKQYLSAEIRKVRTRNPQSPDLALYEGVFEIILMTERATSEHAGLLLSIKKITDFAKQASDAVLLHIIPLFYNKFFRNLYAHALHLYWSSNHSLFHADNLSKFDGYQEAKELLTVLRQRLAMNAGNEDLSQLTQYIKLLFTFEKDAHESSRSARTALDYREQAFHFLDWIPVFVEHSSKQILVNLFLQTGIKFQQASMLEDRPVNKMADEQLALKMYLTAISIGHNSTPDVENYANTYTLKYIAAFQFQDAMLSGVIVALKRRALIIADVFPFMEAHQSNVAFLRQENKVIHLMRQLLTTMIKIQEYNKTHSESIVIDHSAVTILYQAYEACLKNWYQEEYDLEVEKKFRLDLMEELLFENSWTFLDVEQRIDSPWIMIDRDENGWMKPTRSLPFSEDRRVVKYKTIHGAEVNHKTGEINFFMTPWTDERPIYEKVFTLFDLQEMLENNTGSAIFSLDPVDPDKAYHPFNAMRFWPSNLCESELLNTMLLTDYVLKFLTTNQEVQGQYPFEQRPVSSMIQHLPAYLRKVIDDFHGAQHEGALHRFWIEAAEINVSVSDEVMEKEGIARIGLGDLKMIVKKHRMERDIHGELKDVGNEDEGWPIYVLTPAQMQELKRGTRVIEGPAMIFIYAEVKLFYWENNAILYAHIPNDYDVTLIRLYKQPKALNGKVEENIENMRLLYRVTKEMAHQAGLPHRYSPEFIFAHEFTAHYDEFAQYLPEFGRLKELSKISALIRFLNGMRASNQESIQALDYLLKVPPLSPAPDTDTYREFNKNYKDVCKNITSIFQEWRRDLSSSALQRKWRNELTRIKDSIGTLNYTQYSPEVNIECQHQCDHIYRNSQGYSRSEIEKIIDGKRSDIASKLSTSKQAHFRSQMMELYSSELSCLGSSAYGKLIDSFMQGNINSLADALVNYEKTKAQHEINKQFPTSSARDIAQALDDGGDAAATRVATEEARQQLKQQKGFKDNIESGFVRINLGKDKEPINLEGECYWVPASVRHDVRRDDTGLTRYSFFVYGGVSVQPRINVVQGGNRSLGGNAVGRAAFSNVNGQAAMNRKMSALQSAQKDAVRTQQFSDGRVRYYGAERSLRTPGPTRGAAYVTEHNTKTGQVRSWNECYDHQGNVNRIHPKMKDGQSLQGQHYPPTGAEKSQWGLK